MDPYKTFSVHLKNLNTGITGTALCTVVYDKDRSDFADIKTRVQQGFVLGHLLLITFQPRKN